MCGAVAHEWINVHFLGHAASPQDLFTPLMAATVHGHYEVAKLLILAGADHTTIQLDMPSDRSTALDRAQTDQMQASTVAGPMPARS